MSTLAQITYGFTITTGTNDLLDFVSNGVTCQGTVAEGDYSAKGFAAAVQTAMQGATGAVGTETCTFDMSTLKFTLGGTATFSLLRNTGAGAATSPWTLLGFNTSADSTGSTSYISAAAIGTSPSTATLWTMAEPLSYRSPMTAQAAGASASLLQRESKATQTISDGGVIESTYWSTVKALMIEWKALTSTDYTAMESFLDWIEQGKPFTFQPDSTSASYIICVPDMNSVAKLAADFEWLTRSELSYGRLRFYQDTSR